MLYTTIQLQQVARGSVQVVNYTTYNSNEEIFSLPSLEEKEKNWELEIISQWRFQEDFVDDNWDYICSSSDDRYNAVKEYISYSEWELANIENTFFL